MNNPNASTEIEAVLMRWMKLEPIIQSEVRQKEKEIMNNPKQALKLKL